MKKTSTVRVNGNRIFKGHQLTIGLDLGDRSYQVAAPTELGTPTMHRAKIAQPRVRMEGWRQRRPGSNGRNPQKGREKKEKNTLDSDRPSHGRSCWAGNTGETYFSLSWLSYDTVKTRGETLGIAGATLAIVICAILLLVLGAIIRFSFVGAAREKGWQQRLQKPQRAKVEAKWGIRLPELLETYFQSDTVCRSDFYLAPIGTKESEWWYIERFLPLTPRDVSEWISATKVPGIPIAIDASKGTYYLPFESLRQQKSPVVLRLPGRKRNEVEVASTLAEFVRFEPKSVPGDE